MGDYGEAARLLEAVQQLAAHFKAFASIPKIAELSGRLAGLEVRPASGLNSDPKTGVEGCGRAEFP